MISAVRAIAVIAIAGSLCSPVVTAAGRPNFVFLLVDDLRVDATSVTGHPFASTPQIDRIANEGMRFRNAFATTPLCSPSRASFLTGKYARSHGVRGNGTDLDLASQVIYPALLQANGYETAFLGKWHMGNNPSPHRFRLLGQFSGPGRLFRHGRRPVDFDHRRWGLYHNGVLYWHGPLQHRSVDRLRGQLVAAVAEQAVLPAAPLQGRSRSSRTGPAA